MAKRKMSRKQRAAALRNLKKARAAKRKGKKGSGSICFTSVKKVANYMRSHGYKVVKK